jgi:cytochrome P450
MEYQSDSAVADWASDFDILNAEYLANPFTIWDELRSRCPIAHTDRRGSSWLPTRYDDVTAIAHDVEHFSSTDPTVIASDIEGSGSTSSLAYGIPPISADPPLHTWTRRILLPWFSRQRVSRITPHTRELCRKLASDLAERGHGDASADYAQQIPVRVIADVLGVPDEMSDSFTCWVRDILDGGDDAERRNRGVEALLGYFMTELQSRRKKLGNDLFSALLKTTAEGEPLEDGMVLGMAAMVLIAGVDTTWSAIGSSLLHLAHYKEDRERLAAEPDLMPLVVEEFLRAYSPVTMTRLVTEDTEFNGCPMKKGDKVLMNFPAANRDPRAFEKPNVVMLDRAENRHVAFGSGIHRCAGSNLARMELRVALEEWLRIIPTYALKQGTDITWSGGQVRGPSTVPIVIV